MKTTIPLILIFALGACKKENMDPGTVKEFTIQSTSNGANYTMKVSVPDNYDPANKKYSTIYVLDGEENLDLVGGTVRKESSAENLLVVAIGYGNDRTLDYTPTDAMSGGGGAQKFLQFIKEELIPKMELDLGADTNRKSRTILGHSFGGLFASYAFAKDNAVFGNYIILSPSIWYDNEIILTMEKENRAMNQNRHQLVFLGLGQMENEGRMQAPFQAFKTIIQKNYPDLILGSNIEARLEHRGSENPNIRKGLQFFFQNR